MIISLYVYQNMKFYPIYIYIYTISVFQLYLSNTEEEKKIKILSCFHIIKAKSFSKFSVFSLLSSRKQRALSLYLPEQSIQCNEGKEWAEGENFQGADARTLSPESIFKSWR